MADARDLTNPLAPFTEESRPRPIGHADLEAVLGRHQPFIDPALLLPDGEPKPPMTLPPPYYERLEGAVVTDFIFAHQLTEFDFTACAFASCDFDGADLTNAGFHDCIFENVTFDLCVFRKGEFSNCRFINVKFIRCDFTKAAIRHSRLTDVLFSECTFLVSGISRCLLEGSFLPEDRELFARANVELQR